MVRVRRVRSVSWMGALLYAGVGAPGCGDSAPGAPDGGDRPDASTESFDAADVGADADLQSDGGADAFAPSVLLFGGDSGADLLADTWSWDGASWTGELSSAQPDPRRGHALAYDSARGRVVLFGGFDGSVYGNDTWEWEGALWESQGASPPEDLRGRFRHDLAYDGAGENVVLFGGSHVAPDAGEVVFGDTWLWDGDTWEQAGSGDIAARAGHAMAYDAAQDEVILFGGDDGGEPSFSATWVWGEAGWTEVSAPSESPPGRSDHALAYDPLREKVVLFGGSAGGTLRNDTWEWDGQARTWTEMEVEGAQPTARSNHDLVYDPAREEVLLFGGVDADDKRLSETRAWDGSQWKELSGEGTRGPARSGHALARAPRF